MQQFSFLYCGLVFTNLGLGHLYNNLHPTYYFWISFSYLLYYMTVIMLKGHINGHFVWCQIEGSLWEKESWRSFKQSYAAAIQFGQFLVIDPSNSLMLQPSSLASSWWSIPQTVLCCSHPVWPDLDDPSNSLMLQPSSLASSWWSLKQSCAAAIKFGQILVIPQTVLCCSHPVGTDLGDPSNSLVLQPSSRDRSWWSLKQSCAAAIQ